MTKQHKKSRTDFMAMVAPKSRVKKRGVLKADLYRLRQVVGNDLKAGVTKNGDFILYATESSTWQKLVKVLPFFFEFREQRVDPLRVEIDLFEIIDEDTPLIA